MRKRSIFTVLSIVLVLEIAFQVSAKDKEDSGPFGAIWEAIRSLQQQISAIISMEAPVVLVNNDNEPTLSATNSGQGPAGHFGGDVEITGDLVLDGKLAVDSIDVSQITGLLGEGYTRKFPDVMNNSAFLMIDFWSSGDKVVIIQGPGFEIERVEGYGPLGHHDDQPGFMAIYPLVFEYGGSDAALLKELFDQYESGTWGLSWNLSVPSFEWNNWVEVAGEGFLADGYEESIDGRTRFQLIPTGQSWPPTFLWINGLLQNERSVNPETDTLVQVDGRPEFYPKAEIDEIHRKLTLSFDYNEGGFLYVWAMNMLGGAFEKRDVSIIEEAEPGIPGTEVLSERVYHGCFPLRFEMLEGFSLLPKLKTQVVLSYDWSEQLYP